MAVDEALLRSFGDRDDSLPVLRFYRWKPSTLSLGRFQNSGVGLSSSVRDRVPVVRRMTGGGAIWHANELTYSLVCRQAHVASRGVKASFEWLCRFLIEGYRDLEIPASFAKDAVTDERFGVPTPACFASKEEYDIVVRTRKLGGNAQKRERDVIFQHGSIPMRLDWGEWNTMFDPKFRPDPSEVTSIEEQAPGTTIEALVATLIEAFRRSTGAPIVADELTADERAHAHELVRTKYGRSDWTWNPGGALRPTL